MWRLWCGWWFLSRAERHTAPCAFLVAPATSYRVRAYQEAAERLGVHLVLGAQGGLSLLASGQDGVRVDPSNPNAAVERLCDYARRFSPRAVLATDDSTVELAARVAEVLGLDHNSARASRISRRKDLARQILADAGLPVPPWRLIRLDKALEPQLVGTSYPAVVKPLAFAGSRGVIRANSPAELERACERVRLLLAECSEPEERLQVLEKALFRAKRSP